ncbi:MAG: hypothetical protein CM15mP77_3760 [Synechococcus sp.]|nr:MAG: hypothetical protein CM15mP77_3760 [Synechococcus sp.]
MRAPLAGRRARLIRIDLGSGRLQQELPLPQVWQASPRPGPWLNKGPESLTALGPGDLLLAAEAPLLQHQSADGISLMRRRPGEGSARLGSGCGGTGRYDGLTELLALPTRQQLLGLRRGFEPRIGGRPASAVPLPEPRGLRCSRSSAGTCGKGRSAAGQLGGHGAGPWLSDGRQTLVLASDDNFNPLQSSWLQC